MSKLSKKRQSKKKTIDLGTPSYGGNRGSRRSRQIEKLRPSIPKRELTTDELSAYKREMSRVIEYANFQIDHAIETSGVSLELDRFLQGDATKRFNINGITDPGSLRAYMSNVDVIVKSLEPYSKKGMIDSALAEAEAYRGQFGGQHKTTYIDESGVTRTRHYNIAPVFDEQGNIIRRAVRPDLAAKAFSAYRRLEEQYAGYIGRQGQELMFGSENLIILLYDFYERNPGADSDYGVVDYSTDDALVNISPMLSQWINQQLLEMERADFTANQASRIIADWDDFLDKRYF